MRPCIYTSTKSASSSPSTKPPLISFSLQCPIQHLIIQ